MDAASNCGQFANSSKFDLFMHDAVTNNADRSPELQISNFHRCRRTMFLIENSKVYNGVSYAPLCQQECSRRQILNHCLIFIILMIIRLHENGGGVMPHTRKVVEYLLI